MNYTVSTRKRSAKWSYQILVDGVYHSSGSGYKTKSDAKKAGDKAALLIKSQPVESKLCFKNIAMLYIADGAKEPATKTTYLSWLKVYKPIWQVEVTKLTYSEVAPIIQDYYINHKYLSTKSILAFGKSIINFATDKLDIQMKNPFLKVKIVQKNDKSKKEHEILTLDEMRTLFEKIEDPKIRFLSMCFGLAGLRISEARALTFNSFTKSWIEVNKQRQRIDRKVILKSTTKSSNSERKVPLHPDLKKALADLPLSLNKDRLIIEEFIPSETISKVYRNLGHPKLTPHSLRHAYATNCIQHGIDLKTLSQILGDKLETVMGIYSHVNTEMLDRAADILTKI